jgi:hypothetical protein
MSNSHSAPSRTLRRPPLVVTLLAFYDVVMVAVVPGVLALAHHFGTAPADRNVLLVFGTLTLSAGLIWTAADAWYGRPWARYGLMGLASVYYVGLAAGAPWSVDLASLLHVDSSTLAVVLRVVRSLFWIGLHAVILFVLGRDHFEVRRT